jgi:hypothetical protein
MSTCKVYKNQTLLGSGSIAANGTTITGWSAQAGAPAVARKNVQVAITSSTNVGATFNARVTNDDGAGTLTINKTNPFST